VIPSFLEYTAPSRQSASLMTELEKMIYQSS